MKRIIVNADDFGLSDHTVEWTIKGFECGAISSATIMAGMSATDKAIAYARVLLTQLMLLFRNSWTLLTATFLLLTARLTSRSLCLSRIL